MAKRRKFWLGLVKIGVSASLIGYLVYHAWTSDEFDVLFEGGIVLWQYGLAVLCAFAAISITFVRWFYLVRGLEIPFRMWDALRFGFVGYFFNFVTVGTVGGDALRAFFVARQSPGQRTEAVATVIFDRAIGLVALFILTGSVMLGLDLDRLAGDDEVRLRALQFCRLFSLIGGTLGLLGLVGVCAFRTVQHWSLWQRLFRLPLVGALGQKLYLAGLVYASRPGVVIGAFLGSFPVHILNAVSVYLIAVSLPIEHPDLMSHMAAVPLSNLAAVLPLPGGIGAFEGMLTLLYGAMGAGGEAGKYGFLVATGFRLITLMVAALGVVIYFADRREIDSITRETSSSKPNGTELPSVASPTDAASGQ